RNGICSWLNGSQYNKRRFLFSKGKLLHYRNGSLYSTIRTFIIIEALEKAEFHFIGVSQVFS
ncbi:hypothetical protein, partial [Ferviditalea candida]|nr:hypothetical protein [Paenibacillaceae bacterium T2]